MGYTWNLGGNASAKCWESLLRSQIKPTTLSFTLPCILLLGNFLRLHSNLLLFLMLLSHFIQERQDITLNWGVISCTAATFLSVRGVHSWIVKLGAGWDDVGID